MDRTIRILDAITTPAKQRVLAATILQPQRSWYLHELSRHLVLPPSTVQHELRLFASVGLLTSTKHGNRVYYQADVTSPIHKALSGLLLKTSGLADVVRQSLEPLAANIELAFIYSSRAAGQELSTSDVDLMIVGSSPLSEISAALSPAEGRIGRSINPTVYSGEEFSKKVRERNHFLTAVFEKELLFVHGTADDLARLTRGSRNKASPDKPRRASRPARRRRARPKGRKNR